MSDEEKALESNIGSTWNDKSSSKSRNSDEVEVSHEIHDRHNGVKDEDDKTNADLPDVEKGLNASRNLGPGESSLSDSSLVSWDGDNDPENPLNFGFGKKVWMSMMASYLTFCVGFASSIFSAATTVTAEKFGVGEEVMILGVSLYVLGFACGPLVFGPISELYGRQRPLLIGIFCFCIMNIPVAVAQNVETILVCRFLTAMFGASAVAIGPAILVDLWTPYPRGIATLLWATTVFAAPTLGPLVGAFVVANPNMGWRWTGWLPFLVGIVLWLLSVFTASETFAPIILQKKAARLRFETRNWALHSKRDEQPVQYSYLALKYGIRPLQMLAQEPILLALTSFMSLVYALIYLTFFAFPYSFMTVRGWSGGISSLPFLSLLIGYLVGCGASMLESRLRYQKLLHKHSGNVAPEERLPPMIIGSVILIGGLFWFAWTSSPNINWAPQVIAGVPIGCGIFMIFMPGQVYITDVYTANAASAFAGNAFVRAALACAFPLFAGPMYSRLGVDWATSLLAFICVGLAPFPVLFYMYGKKIRGMSKFVIDNS